MHSDKPLWLRTLALTAFLSMLFGLIHISDAIVRAEIGGPALENIDATGNALFAVVYLVGIALSWNERQSGFLLVLVLSALSSWGFFGHATGITPPNLTEIGRISGVFFVFVVLVGAVASVSAVLLSVYTLSKRRN